MLDILLGSVEYYGYISIVKFVVYLILLFSWLPLVAWVYRDTENIEADQTMWTSLILGAGGVSLLVMLLVPFIIGLILYLIAVGTAAIMYVNYRNARVMDFDRILTPNHIKSLFSRGEDQQGELSKFKFRTANKNEVPLPEPRTTDFYGYKSAHDIIVDASWRRASSVVFSQTSGDCNVTYLIDGVPLKQPALDREQAKYFIHFIKNVADLNTKEKRKPQKGKFSVILENKESDWEITTAGSTAGEQIQLKHKTKNDIKKLPDLGLTTKQLESLENIRELKQGLFIVSGPAKSGVTTTFYSLLGNHDAFLNSIHTLEKKPSVQLFDITQEVFSLTDTGTTTYADKLETLIRMGPDIVGVADCVDSRTATNACEAALDGKIVYVVLEADNVVQATVKWLKLVGNRKLATEPLLGISNQRLMRNLCPECKQAYAPNKELLKKFNLPAEKAKVLYKAGKVQYDKHGKPSTCEDCQGIGYAGRSAIFELIMTDEKLKKAIRESKSVAEISKNFRAMRMLYLQEQALKKIVAGITAVKEMVRVLTPPQKKPQRKA